MKERAKKAIKIVGFTLCAVIIFSFLSTVFERKTYTGAWNYMAKLNEFYSLEEHTLDYIGVGSSHMYCTLNPLEVWKKTGAAGFVLATQQQPLRASYHYIKEAFKTQSPKYVILEGYMICAEEAHDSAVLYDAIDPLRPSWNKFQMINSLIPYEQRPEYYFNILKYHSRWSSITAEEINRIFEEHIDTNKGFVALDGSFSGNNLIPDYENTRDIPLSKYNLDILNDIYDLTKAHDAELILMFGPYESSSAELTEKIKAEITWANQKGIPVLDYAQLLNTIGIDPEQDYYDARHLDVSGAAKVSSHFADYLLEKGIGKNDSIDAEKWSSDYTAYAEAFSSELTAGE